MQATPTSFSRPHRPAREALTLPARQETPITSIADASLQAVMSKLHRASTLVRLLSLNTSGNTNIERDALHLVARLEGLLHQVDDVTVHLRELTAKIEQERSRKSS
jgi:hypothetical protein